LYCCIFLILILILLLGRNAIRDLNARLPLKSNGLWYRDEIGNVSTSRAMREVIKYKFII